MPKIRPAQIDRVKIRPAQIEWRIVAACEACILQISAAQVDAPQRRMRPAFLPRQQGIAQKQFIHFFTTSSAPCIQGPQRACRVFPPGQHLPEEIQGFPAGFPDLPMLRLVLFNGIQEIFRQKEFQQRSMGKAETALGFPSRPFVFPYQECGGAQVFFQL
ncbi:MAG: hypothetical protein LBP86_01305, partial [Azoarcus sp.]|nr:hypothetical protein [Azoarcus sp.]